MTDHQKLLDYSTDPEDCEACFEIEATCPYHQGVAAGVEWFSQHLANIAEDPERLNALARRRAGQPVVTSALTAVSA